MKNLKIRRMDLITLWNMLSEIENPIDDLKMTIVKNILAMEPEIVKIRENLKMKPEDLHKEVVEKEFNVFLNEYVEINFIPIKQEHLISNLSIKELIILTKLGVLEGEDYA